MVERIMGPFHIPDEQDLQEEERVLHDAQAEGQFEKLFASHL